MGSFYIVVDTGVCITVALSEYNSNLTNISQTQWRGWNTHKRPESRLLPEEVHRRHLQHGFERKPYKAVRP